MHYRAEIDGLRALAVLPVILFHAGIPLFGGGYTGVDVFFVISGFLITTIIYDDICDGRFSLIKFYERRCRRLLPPLFVVILVTAAFSLLVLQPNDLKNFSTSILAVLTFTSNFFFWQSSGYFETASELQPLLHTWSLAVEEQFYIFFPFLMLAIPRRLIKLSLILISAVSLYFAQWIVWADQSQAFYMLPFRAWELLLGSLAALYLKKYNHFSGKSVLSSALAAIGVILICGSVFLYKADTIFPGVNALPPVIGTVLVVVFARRENFVGRMLSIRPLVWVGLVSYSAYLWHQPLFALFKQRFGSDAFHHYSLLLAVGAFILAWLSYKFVEQPFRRGMPTKVVITSCAFVAALLCAVALMMRSEAISSPTSLPAYKRALANIDESQMRYIERRDVYMKCGGSNELGVQQCDFGDTSAEITLVLWGDSLAQALLSGIDTWAANKGIHGRAFIANGCPPVITLANTQVPACSAGTHGEIMSRILSLQHVTDVVITGNMSGAILAGNVTIDGRSTSVEAVREKLYSTIERIRSKGARVIMLEQGPIYPEDVSKNIVQNLLNPESKPQTILRKDYVDSIKVASDLQDLPDVYVSTVDVFCNSEECPSVDGEGKMVIFDRNHVTREYAIILVEFLAQEAGL